MPSMGRIGSSWRLLGRICARLSLASWDCWHPPTHAFLGLWTHQCVALSSCASSRISLCFKPPSSKNIQH